MISGSDGGMLVEGRGKSMEHREQDRGGALGKVCLFFPCLQYGGAMTNSSVGRTV
jgi:hypothetical protein